MKKRMDGAMPLVGRLPNNPIKVLLEALVEDLRPVVDKNDCKVMLEVLSSGDSDLYDSLDKWWGLRSINPTRSVSAVSRNAALYLFSNILKKHVPVDGSSQLEAATVQKFLHYEAHCREYNREGYKRLTWSDDLEVQTYFGRMRSFIENVLGPVDLNVILAECRHGPGRTAGLSARYGHRFYKNFCYPYEVTEDAVVLARRAIACDERWVRFLEASFNKPFSEIHNDSLFQIVPGNFVLFVPKKKDILRTIACEPTMNVYLQLGIGVFIDRRLKKFGVHLDDQSLNQRLARIGSLDNSLATLDLEGASATVTCKIVEKLFPFDWAMLLMSLRCDVGTFKSGLTVRYEQLSSMGNGFTFSVESLIFAAMVYAVGGELGDNSAVYGDDIIVPSESVPAMFKLIHCCGFLINEEKSFFTPTFTRESCGTDYEKGYNIRPVFIKKDLEVMNLFEIYSLHNKLMKWFHTFVGPGIPRCCYLIQRWLPKQFLIYGPPDKDDLSSNLANPVSTYGYDSFGYRLRRAIAASRDHRKKFLAKSLGERDVIDHEIDIEDDRGVIDLAFMLNHDLRDCASEEGTKLTLTVRDDYRILLADSYSHCYEWPLTY